MFYPQPTIQPPVRLWPFSGVQVQLTHAERRAAWTLLPLHTARAVTISASGRSTTVALSARVATRPVISRVDLIVISLSFRVGHYETGLSMSLPFIVFPFFIFNIFAIAWFRMVWIGAEAGSVELFSTFVWVWVACFLRLLCGFWHVYMREHCFPQIL